MTEETTKVEQAVKENNKHITGATSFSASHFVGVRRAIVYKSTFTDSNGKHYENWVVVKKYGSIQVYDDLATMMLATDSGLFAEGYDRDVIKLFAVAVERRMSGRNDNQPRRMTPARFR